MQLDGNCNNKLFSGDFENNNRAGENDNKAGDGVNSTGENAELENLSVGGREAVGERREFQEPSECSVVSQESEGSGDFDATPPRIPSMRNCKSNGARASSGMETEPRLSCGSPSQEEPVEKLRLPFLCTYCGKRFRLRSYMNRHIREQHTGSNRGEYVCQQCGNVYSSKMSLQKHMKRIHPIQGFPCKHVGCAEVFMSRAEASQHYKNLHVLDKISESSLAEKQTFSNPRTETDGVSLKACNLCGKSFRHRSSLDEHMKRCKTRHSNALINNFNSEEETVTMDSSALMEKNENFSKVCSTPEVDYDKQEEECFDGWLDDERENEMEIFGTEDQGETVEASLSELAAQGEDDLSQYHACPFCAKSVSATQFDKHVRKHQPITRAIN